MHGTYRLEVLHFVIFKTFGSFYAVKLGILLVDTNVEVSFIVKVSLYTFRPYYLSYGRNPISLPYSIEEVSSIQT